MRKVVSIVSGLAALGLMIASNMVSGGSSERLNALATAGMQVGRTEVEMDRLQDSDRKAEGDAARLSHMVALDDYKEALIAASLPAGAAKLLGYAALVFLTVSVAASWTRDRIRPE
jgi:hypothetical protein